MKTYTSKDKTNTDLPNLKWKIGTSLHDQTVILSKNSLIQSFIYAVANLKQWKNKNNILLLLLVICKTLYLKLTLFYVDFIKKKKKKLIYTLESKYSTTLLSITKLNTGNADFRCEFKMRCTPFGNLVRLINQGTNKINNKHWFIFVNNNFFSDLEISSTLFSKTKIFFFSRTNARENDTANASRRH